MLIGKTPFEFSQRKRAPALSDMVFSKYGDIEWWNEEDVGMRNGPEPFGAYLDR